MDLPSVLSRPKIKSYSGASLQGYLEPQLTKALVDYVLGHGGSLFTGLLTLWTIVLHKYTAMDDIIIGSPVSGRSHGDLSDQIGFYLNMLALRNWIDPGESFESCYGRINDDTLEAYDHQMYPFDRLVEELDHSHGVSRSAVFDILLDLHTQNEGQLEPDWDEDQMGGFTYREDEISKLDMEIIFREQSDYLSFYIRYNKDVYQREMVEGLMIHFKRLLSLVLAAPEKPLKELVVVSRQEKDRLLNDFNQTHVIGSNQTTVLDLFTEQVVNTPDATALIFKESLLSYKELDELSNQLARCLISQYHITDGSMVGLQLDRSHWVLVSVLGILKSGASYVPIAPELPDLRKSHICDDTKMELLITETSYMFDTDYYQGALFAIDVEFSATDFS
ncbi:MAG: condensation domain-containing protein, partial [Bacteroidota bacterium]